MPSGHGGFPAALFSGLLSILLLAWVSTAYADELVMVNVDRSTRVGISHFSIGVTHTAPKWEDGNPHAVTRAKQLLKRGLKFQNQHLMNWGTDNPEPRSGVFNWTSLDKRIALIRSMHGIPIITLCSAPGWMNTSGEDQAPQTGPDNWADARVADNHVVDFADLSRRVALRYPGVKYFQVWNEYKGYRDNDADNWDYKRYTDFYNSVYDAIKSVRPEAQVGGPYYPFQGRPCVFR
jgi:hypothetical protein